MRLSNRQGRQSLAAHWVVSVGVTGKGAGSGLVGAAGSGSAGAGVGAGFRATLRAAGRFRAFAAAFRFGARLATTFLFALVARFSTRFFALVFDFALLLGLADLFVFAFLAMSGSPVD
jgi:hypothetical protein